RTDSYDPSNQSIYDAGPQAILLNVYATDRKYKYLKENMDFIEIQADDRERTRAQIKAYMDGMRFPTYVFNYNSFDRRQDHKVVVKLRGTEHRVQLAYRFPEDNNLVGNRIIGLYLTLSGKGMGTVKRTLAGYEPHRDYYTNP